MADQSEILTDSVQTDDAPYGQVMFTVFTAAVVLVSLAVALLSVSSTWWMLGVVFGIHLTGSTVVCVVIARALLGRTDRQGRPPFIGYAEADAADAAPVVELRSAPLARAA